ncbi:MAG: hypothetical protein HYY52_00620 [Candidatus Melainabacteria bacterium]|nr:hypothetical protein [Candidatus Melainabacteria bacterium]
MGFMGLSGLLPFSLGTARTPQEKNAISTQAQIANIQDKISAPNETALHAVMTILQSVVGKELTHPTKHIPVRYEVAKWYTKDTPQNGRNKVPVPGFLTLEITSILQDPKENKFDYYFFILDPNFNDSIKLIRIKPGGEATYRNEHFALLWETLLKQNSLNAKETIEPYGLKLRETDTLSVVTFSEEDF